MLVCRTTSVLMLCLAAAAAAAATTVELVGGHAIRGHVLQQTSDRLVVDVGFAVVEVPAGSVIRLVEEGEPERPEAAGPTDRLFDERSARAELSVKENVPRCAEAVVQVRTPTTLGSGFVIQPSGYLVTNQHVISGEHQITVTVFEERDGELVNRRFDTVRIVALSPELDLALLKIDDAGDREFATVPLGRSEELRQGQTVFALGSPLGLDRSVSHGIVSLTQRVMGGQLYIQTTAQINPGNSGGPLFNLAGEVVGVSNLKLLGIGLEGLSFAIPASTVRHFLSNRSAFAFDPRNSNAGFRYPSPPRVPDGDPLFKEEP